MSQIQLSPHSDLAHRADFQAQQQRFCAWLRRPSEQALPADVAPARMQVYRDLLYHNVCNFIDLVYPVAQALVGQAQWKQWQQAFFASYRCQSPFYLDISLHFREFLAAQTTDELESYPWLHELLQYEWLELYLDTFDSSSFYAAAACSHPQSSMQKWQLTQPIWVLVYQYPVYRWQPDMQLDSQTQHPEPSAIVVWRDQDHVMQLRSLTPLQAVCLEALAQQALSTDELLQHCLPYWSVQPPSALEQMLKALQQQLCDWQLLATDTVISLEDSHDS